MKKILIIDDDISTTQLLSNDFQALGHDTICCSSAQEAFDQLKGTVFDLIILSVELPDQNGYVLCSKLRKEEATAGIPIFIVSNAATDAAFHQHVNLPTHADGYFLKPLDMELLIQSMNSIFEQYDAYKAQYEAQAEQTSVEEKHGFGADGGEQQAKHEEMIDVGGASDIKPSADDSEVLKAINIDNIDLFGDIDANDVDDDVGEIFDDDAPFVIQENFDISKEEKNVEKHDSPVEKKAEQHIAPVAPIPPIPLKETVGGTKPAAPPSNPGLTVTRHPTIPPVGGIPRPNAVPPIAGISRPAPAVPPAMPPVASVNRMAGVPSPAVNAEMSKLNAEIETLKAELAALKNEDAAVKNELSAAKESADAANIDLCATKSELSRLQAELSGAKADIEQKDAYILELQNANSVMVSPEQYNELVNQYNEFQTHYNELVDQFNDLSVRCTTAETKLAELDSENGNVSTQLQELLNVRDAKNSKIRDVISILSTLIDE